MYIVQREFSNEIFVQQRSKKVGILGGTFNPPHNGHLFIAENTFFEFALDEVLILPVGNPPHKKDLVVANRKERGDMAALLADERPFLKLCDIELKREGYTYTVDTLRQLREEASNSVTYYYIIGTDTLFELETWKDFRDVFALVEFICIKRPGDRIGEVLLKLNDYKTRYGKSLYLASFMGPDISSTSVREMYLKGESIDNMVSKSIIAYMEKHNVFRG